RDPGCRRRPERACRSKLFSQSSRLRCLLEDRSKISYFISSVIVANGGLGGRTHGFQSPGIFEQLPDDGNYLFGLVRVGGNAEATARAQRGGVCLLWRDN